MSSAKPHQNDFLLPGQQVVVIPLWYWHCECSDESLLFTEADIVGMLFSSGTLFCKDVGLFEGQTCLDNCTCCHTETEVVDQTCHLTQWHYTDQWPTCPSTDPKTPGIWEGGHYSTSFCVPCYISGVCHFGWDFLCTWPFYNPTTEVITFCLRGWCMLGVFLLLAFTRLGHECWDLLSLCICAQARPWFIPSPERVLGEWSQNPC